MDLPPEFRLVAACCRWPPSPSRDEAVRRASEGVDWTLTHRIAARHRVEALVADALGSAGVALPEPIAEALRAARSRIVRQNLFLTAESIRLRALVEGAGIALLFVKGVTLGVLAYGSIGPKMGRDIDLLVLPEDVERAASLLEGAGYEMIVPEGPSGRKQLQLWHRHWKESVWLKRAGDVHVELHTALSDNPRLLKPIGLGSARVEVEVGNGVSLPTLARDELFAYLCVHGASSAWFRLKWIADVAALLGEAPPEEVERLYRRSQELGAGRAAAQALLLRERLFETPLSPGLAAELRADRVNRWLLKIALRKLAGRGVHTELDDMRLGTASIHLMQLGLLPGLKFKLSELWRQSVSPYDRLAVPLPRPLGFLYPAVGVVRRLGGLLPRRARASVDARD